MQGSCEHANPSRCDALTAIIPLDRTPGGNCVVKLLAIDAPVPSPDSLGSDVNCKVVTYSSWNLSRRPRCTVVTTWGGVLDWCATISRTQSTSSLLSVPRLLRVSLCAICAAFPPVAVFCLEGCCAHTGETYTCTHVCPLCIFKHSGI